jgi:predicted sulfurtransferase
MVHCRGICDENESHDKWYNNGCTYCPKCTVRFGPDKFLIMNTDVKRCICCHERLRQRPKIRHTKQKRIEHVYI